MRFNIVGHSFYGKSTGYYNFKKEAIIGGGEVYLYDFAKFLLKEGHDVTVIQARDKTETFEIDGIRVKGYRPIMRLTGSAGIIERYGLFNLTWKSHLDKNVDRVHLHDFMHGFPFANKTMTGTCHGITWDNPYWTKLNKQGIQLRMYRTAIRPIAKYCIKHLKKVIANDTFLLRFVQSEMPQYRENIHVILNYVKTDIFNDQVTPRFRKEYPSGSKIILFPRNFGYGRGAINTIEAMRIVIKTHPEAIILMVGDGPERPLCEQLVEKYHLQKNVIFLGHKDHFQEMPHFFASADIVLIPSVSTEGTSLSALEGMASKKPVVVTNIGGLLDIVIDGFNGAIAKPEPNSMAEKIIFLLDNPSEAKRLANEGFNWVRSRHNYKLWCKQYKVALDI